MEYPFSASPFNLLCDTDVFRCICIPTALPVNLAAVEPVAFQLPNVDAAVEAAAAHTLHADVVAAAQHAESDAHDNGGAGAGGPQRRAQTPSSPSVPPHRANPPNDAAKEAEQRRAQDTARALAELRAELRGRRPAAAPQPARPEELRAAPMPAWLLVLVLALIVVAALKLSSLH